MKKSLVILAVLFLVLGIAATASATSISYKYISSFDWDANVSQTGRTWALINNPNYSFQLGDFELPENGVICRAKLFLVHRGNKAREGKEVWKLDFNGDQYDLKRSRKMWRRQRIILNSESFSEGLNPLLFTLSEWTPGKDRIRLDKAIFKLRFCAEEPPTNSVPDPPTIMLLGSGMIALTVWGRRRMRKA
ncbi:MAG: PEP-CTERM sorting domain-containing protein [Planctomycetota bacterium]|jgi:hypothetical protein